MITVSVVPNDIKSRHPPFKVPNSNQVQVGTVHPVAPSVCPSSDDIITSVVFLPFSYSPPLTVFPATGLLSRPRPLFIPISPWQCFLLRLVLCLSFVLYSSPSHLIALPQFDLCLNNVIHCDLAPVRNPIGHISPSIFVSIPVAPWPVRVFPPSTSKRSPFPTGVYSQSIPHTFLSVRPFLVPVLLPSPLRLTPSTLPPSVLLSYTDPSVIPFLPSLYATFFPHPTSTHLNTRLTSTFVSPAEVHRPLPHNTQPAI
eukprot:g59605.t1